MTRNSYLRADSSGLVRCDHHVGRHKEGPVLGRRNHVVRLVPDPLVHRVEPGGQGQPRDHKLLQVCDKVHAKLSSRIKKFDHGFSTFGLSFRPCHVSKISILRPKGVYLRVIIKK